VNRKNCNINAVRSIAQPLAARRRPTTPLSTFGFSPTHKADAKNQKSLNFYHRSQNNMDFNNKTDLFSSI
jgi:hypothetical protein